MSIKDGGNQWTLSEIRDLWNLCGKKVRHLGYSNSAFATFY